MLAAVAFFAASRNRRIDDVNLLCDSGIMQLGATDGTNESCDDCMMIAWKGCRKRRFLDTDSFAISQAIVASFHLPLSYIIVYDKFEFPSDDDRCEIDSTMWAIIFRASSERCISVKKILSKRFNPRFIFSVLFGIIPGRKSRDRLQFWRKVERKGREED